MYMRFYEYMCPETQRHFVRSDSTKNLCECFQWEGHSARELAELIVTTLSWAQWQPVEQRKLPTHSGWWYGTNKHMVWVLYGKNNVVVYNDYQENIHGFAVTDLPAGVDWKFVADN